MERRYGRSGDELGQSPDAVGRPDRMGLGKPGRYPGRPGGSGLQTHSDEARLPAGARVGRCVL